MMDAGILFIVALLLYMLPTVVAIGRQQSNMNAIAVLNVFLGWTFIGWVIALVWAMTKNKA